MRGTKKMESRPIGYRSRLMMKPFATFSKPTLDSISSRRAPKAGAPSILGPRLLDGRFPRRESN
ncbi:MAG: hypothetical protein ABI679_16825, partial [Gemmatimonadota bacterium]